MYKGGLSKSVVVVLILTMGVALAAQDADRFRLGVQMSSDTYAGLLVYTRFAEASLKLQVKQSDAGGEGDRIIFGGHAGILLRPFRDSTSLSLGAELGSAVITGDAEYAEYVDAGLRLGVNYSLGEHCLLTGLLYPVWIETRELENAGDYSLNATFAKTGVAVSFLF